MFEYLHWQVSEDEALADKVAEIPTGGLRNNLVAGKYGLTTEHRQRIIQSKAYEFLPNTFLPDPGERLGTDKISLVPVNQKLQSSLERIVVGRNIDTPGEITLFQAQAVDRTVTDIGDTKFFASLL